MNQSMTNGRVASLKERIEIVYYCIAQKNDYKQTSDVYNVSYEQVYQWVKKYEAGSENALKEEELTLEDRAKLSMKKLKVENERLKAENAFLKKLEELERRRT
jgi:transposase